MKVILAELDSHGKIVPNTKNAKQTFVPLYTDEQANVTYITAFVNSSMGESDLKLVGNNGISYSDEPGTRGKLERNVFNFIFSLNSIRFRLLASKCRIIYKSSGK